MTMSRAVRSGSLENPSVPLSDATLADWLNSGSGWIGVDSGIIVNPKNSLLMSAVWRGVNLISGVSAALPLKSYTRSSADTRQESPDQVGKILRDPHPELTAFELWRLTYAHRLLWGNFYGFKQRNAAGQIEYIYPLEPSEIQVGCFNWARTEANPTGKIFRYAADGDADDPTSATVLTPVDVLHIPGFGYDGVCGVSPIRMARQGIGLSLAAERAGARLFGSGTMLSGILQTEQRLTSDQSKAIKDGWRAKVSGNANPTDIAVIDSGAKFQSLTMPNSDAQWLETRAFQIQEVERFIGVPPFLMMDTEKSTSWGTGLEQQATGWVTFDLTPTWLKPTEARLTKELLAPSNAYAEYTVDGLMRGDSTARGAYYRIMREVGAYSANDIRRLENRPPIDGGDEYLQPLNLAPLGYDPTKGATP